MHIKTFYFNALRTCCYVVHDKEGHCMIIDPGCFGSKEEQRLVTYIEEHKLTPQLVVNTHGHFDHLMGLPFVMKQYGIPLYIHPLEEGNLQRASHHAKLFGFRMSQPELEYHSLSDGDTLSCGMLEFQVIHTPGHSPGSVCLYRAQDAVLFTGDLLFAGSVGRTDLPGGNYDHLMASLSGKIRSLPPATMVYPGHGPATTVAEECAHNPYLQHLY
ncbi:MAG: MBL fold metallo-hydrolase [Bacteroidales bacterium]|nr:MBL fold metallo-hydrolase [Bacteroidales bacterium]